MIGYSEGDIGHCICVEGRDHIQNGGTACWPGYAASNTGPVMFLGLPDVPEAPPDYTLIAFCPWCGRRPAPRWTQRTRS